MVEPSFGGTAELILAMRFGLVGLLNTAFGYAVFAVFVLAGLWPGIALAGSMIVAMAFSFQTSRRLVFRDKGRRWRFAAVYGAMLLGNWTALRGLRDAGMSELSAQASLALPIAVLSFLGQRYFVFQRDRAA